LTAQESDAQGILSAFDQWLITEFLALAPAMYQNPRPTSDLFDAIAEILDTKVDGWILPGDELQIALVRIAKDPLSASSESLQEAFVFLQTHQQKLPRDLQINAFHSLLSFCQLRQWRQEREENRTLMLDLYNWAIQQDLVRLGPETPINHLGNLITLCLEDGDPGKGQKFLESLRPFIGSADQHLLLFHQARLWLAQGHYQEIEGILKPWKYAWNRFRVPARLLVYQARFEMMIQEGADFSLTEQLKELQREMAAHQDELPSPLYLRYQNHTKWFLQLLSPSANPSALMQMRKELSQTQQVYAKSWLLQKLENH
ncbi:MAG: hypothetical protein AAF399_03085, partial [Bacteroidota bacterium]